MATDEHEPLPGQFRLRALFILMTLAAAAAWIMSLAILLKVRMLLVMVLWLCFVIWHASTLRHPPSARDRFNHGVVGLMGQFIAVLTYLTPLVTRDRPHWWIDCIFTGLMCLGPMVSAWPSLRLIRQGLAESKAAITAPPNS